MGPAATAPAEGRRDGQDLTLPGRTAATLGDVPLPGWLARLNRSVTNPVIRPAAGRLPYFAVVVHRGRRTGRVYRTPVTAFPHGKGFVIALTYGRDVDWVENVLAAGGCRVIHRGRDFELGDPRILPFRGHDPAIPGWIGGVLQLLRVDEVLRLGPAHAPDRER